MTRSVFAGVNRLVNHVVVALGLRRFRGAPLLVLETVGRKTGKIRRTPLLYMDHHGRYIVVASNGGADWEPAWWLNLRSGQPATVRVGSAARVPVTATEVVGAEREVLWRLLNEQTFSYEPYQAKVRRQLAVVALDPSTPSDPA